MSVIIFTEHDDGTVTVDGFPEVLHVAAHLLGRPGGATDPVAAIRPGLLRREGDRLWITAANGSACYLLGEDVPWGPTPGGYVVAHRRFARLLP
jgi:hypothetical protein